MDDFPGRETEKRIAKIKIIMAILIYTFVCILLFSAHGGPHSLYKCFINYIGNIDGLLSPFAILMSALLGGLVALRTVISNRKEFIRQTTMNQLNALDMDHDYWDTASKLIRRIEMVREQSTENRSKSLEEKELKDIDYHKVLRRLEWLMESAAKGYMNADILAYRKAAMIDFIFHACKKMIEDKQNEHCKRYTFSLEHSKSSEKNEDMNPKEICKHEADSEKNTLDTACTKHLVYRYISDDNFRKALLNSAIAQAKQAQDEKAGKFSNDWTWDELFKLPKNKV